MPTDPTMLLRVLREDRRPKEAGRDDAQADTLTPDSNEPGRWEEETIITVGRARTEAISALQRDLQIIDDRLTTESLGARIDAMEKATDRALATADGNVTTHVNDVKDLANVFHDRDEALKRFKHSNNIRRPADILTSGQTMFRWGLLLFFFLAETVINATLLAEVATGGILSGFLMAMGISFVNLAVPCLLFAPWLRYLYHNKRGKKAMGLFGLLSFVALFGVFNMAVAHYREAPSSDAIDNMLSNPWSLPDFASWLLFGIGLAFAVIALIDGLTMADRYPGYSKLEQHRTKARDRLRRAQRETVRDLEHERRQLIDDVGSKRRAVRNAMVEQNRLVNERKNREDAFHEYLNALEGVGRALLKEYREGYRSARHFDAPEAYPYVRWNIDRKVPLEPSSYRMVGEMDGQKAIDQAMSASEEMVDRINDRFRKARIEIDALGPREDPADRTSGGGGAR